MIKPSGSKAHPMRASLALSTRLGVLVSGGLAIFIFVLFGSSVCRAQGTYTAASCNQSDVNAVINGPTHKAVNGDTIIIPATGSPCTWTSGITINGVGIDITGTGTPNTGGGIGRCGNVKYNVDRQHPCTRNPFPFCRAYLWADGKGRTAYHVRGRGSDAFN